MECFLVSFVHWCTILWTPSEQRLLQFAICVSIVSIPARATPLRQRLSMGSLTGCATCARVGANKPHLLASKEALPALGRALSSDDAEVRLNAASAVWALVYDSQKAKAEVKKLAAQGIIILAPSVIHAATKPVDPAIAAAAEAGGPEARAAFAMLQVARLSKAG